MDTDTDHTSRALSCVDSFGEDAADLATGNQDVVRPLQHRWQVAHTTYAVSDCKARQQRQPGPARRSDTVRSHQDGHRNAGSRWRRPGPTSPATRAPSIA